MSYHDKLIVEINKKLDGLEAEKEPWRATWVAHAVCEDHAAGLVRPEDDAEAAEHADFWRHGGYQTCRGLVAKCIGRRAGGGLDEVKPKQESLPGFDHLQTYYMVERDGDEIGVHRDEMTDAELDGKAKFLEDMGAACLSHAKELRRFKHLRRETKAA